MKISFFKRVTQTTPTMDAHIITVLESIKNGKWEDIIHRVRAQTTEEGIKAEKANLPGFTPSGTFSQRNKDAMIEHSGILSIDFDKVKDIAALEAKLSQDKHIFSFFRSASGRGVCALVKIKKDKHAPAFAALAEYFFQEYGEVIDPAPSSHASFRFVSHDPNLYLNEDSVIWAKTPADKNGKAAEREGKKIIFTRTDFDFILEQIQNTGIDITGGYAQWVSIGFAIAKEYGAAGADYFHIISQNSGSYNDEKCQKQYDQLVKAEGRGGNRANMATVFYFAKICGINIANPDTQKLKTIARHAKNGNMTPQDAVMTAKSMNPNLDEAKSLQIVKEVFKSSNEALKVEEGSIIEELKVFLKSNYEVRLNDISEKIEIDGKELTDFMKNSIWGRACESLGKAVKKEYVSNLIKSDLICTVYNPIEDFIRENSHYFGTKGQIDKVIDSLIIANGAYNVDPEDRDLKTSQLLIKKWIVSWFAYMANSYSPLVLVLTGKQGCGKSHWLQNILPKELMPLYAESNLMGGKDDYKLMHSKLLIMNDEFGGKTVSEAKDFKELVSKNEITYRKPYGEEEVKKKRIAVFCGTSNDLEVISDVTGNRRIIALQIMDVFWDAYNKVDKNALFIEAYELFKAGFEWRILKGDIEKLDKLTDMHKSRDAEEELILSMITPSDEKGVFMQSAEILSMIGEKHKTVRLNKNKLGRALNALGFESKVRKANGRTVRGYYVKHLSEA